MVQSIITAMSLQDPSQQINRVHPDDGSPIINISECFSRTIQGEGVTCGCPSVFLRVQHCTLDCVWCDSTEIWRQGNPYTVEELFELFETNGVLEDLKKGHHLVLTGGSPVRQQDALCAFMQRLDKSKIYPIVEIENECTLMPSQSLIDIVDFWNLSPKLANSGIKKEHRYKPIVLDRLSKLNSNPSDKITLCWKFVIASEQEWEEIEEDFIKPGYARIEDIVLMPEGQTREELRKHYEEIIALAVKHGVRVTDRFHITVWNKKTGV